MRKEYDLIERCLEEDREAQYGLYLKYKDAMYTLLVRILNDEDEAKDALQETFIAAFRNLHTFNHESTLGAWIKTIAIRQGLNIQRKRKKDASLYEVGSYAYQQEISWPEDMTADDLEQAIKKLPDGYRTVFVLVEVEGYSHREVGEMINATEGTSRSQLFHAKKRLQQYLNDYR